MSTKKATTTAIAVKEQTSIANLTDLFGVLDVESLNAAIEDISNREGVISNKEKKATIEIIDSWQRSVTEQLEAESSRISSFVKAVRGFSDTFNYRHLIGDPDYFEPMRQIIEIAKIDTTALQEKINAQQLAYNEYQSLRNIGAERSATFTKLESLEKQYEFDKELSIKENTYNSACRELKREVVRISLVFNRNDNVQAALKKLASQAKSLQAQIKVSRDKANAAKMAVSIDDKELRNKLKELLKISVR